MLYVKAEDGKVLELIRKDFKDNMQEVLTHSRRIFNMTSECCLVTPPIYGSVGVLIENFKSLGKFAVVPSFFRYFKAEDCLIYKAQCSGQGCGR